MTTPRDPRFALGARWFHHHSDTIRAIVSYDMAGRPELEGDPTPVPLCTASGRVRVGYTYMYDWQPVVFGRVVVEPREGWKPAMAHGMDAYRHLNDDTNAGAVIGIEAIAGQIERLNYGMHRLLSALVRARLARRPDDALALGIKALLDRGLY